MSEAEGSSPEKDLRTETADRLGDLLRDLRFALRSLRKDLTFTTVAIVTVAIGMAATAAMLSIGYAVLLRPPPIRQPDRVVSVWELRSGNVSTGAEGLLLPYERYEAYRAATGDVFEGLAAHAYARFSMESDQGVAPVDGFITSGDYFSVLGVVPLIGRLYDSDDEASVVLSERLWRSRFGADPGMVGRRISISNRTYTVAGVASAGFTGTMSLFTGDLWIPARAYARLSGTDVASLGVVPIGRLRRGITKAAGEVRVAAVAVSIPPESSRTTVRGARFDRLQWRADTEATLKVGLAVLLATAILVLIIAGTNIAAMTAARSHERRREIAVRLAIGAGRGRLVRLMLTESILLALVGGIGGVVLAYVGTAALSAIRFPAAVTLTMQATPDPIVLLVSFILVAATGVLSGLRPALGATRVDLALSLKAGAQSPAAARRKNHFIVGQLALATLLLVTAGLFLRSFDAVLNVPLGFDPHGVQVASVSVESQGYSEEQGRLFFARLLEEVRALPGVQAAGLGRWVLLGGGNSSRGGRAVDADPDAPAVSIEYNTVDPGYFEANRVELVEGRLFTDDDAQGTPPVAVINQTLAQRLWPGQSAVGRSFRSGDAEYQVVGVVRNGVYVFAAETPEAYSFHPFTQNYRPTMALHIRSAGNSAAIAAQVGELIRGLDPNLAPGQWRSMEGIVRMSTFLQRFTALLSTLFAAIGLFLGVIGVYGLLSVQVARRTREYSIRIALGAQALDVLKPVLGRGARVAAIGCLIGIALSALAGRWLALLLYFAVSPWDPATFAVVPAVLIGAAVVASFVPARRATKADPAEILREE